MRRIPPYCEGNTSLLLMLLPLPNVANSIALPLPPLAKLLCTWALPAPEPPVQLPWPLTSPSLYVLKFSFVQGCVEVPEFGGSGSGGGGGISPLNSRRMVSSSPQCSV